jgi:hypothetical protein
LEGTGGEKHYIDYWENFGTFSLFSTTFVTIYSRVGQTLDELTLDRNDDNVDKLTLLTLHTAETWH